MATGLTLNLYTTKQELDNAKDEVSTIVAWTKGKQPKDAVFHISVSMDICDILDEEVRVNVSKAQELLEKAAEVMGATMGAELEKVFREFT